MSVPAVQLHTRAPPPAPRPRLAAAPPAPPAAEPLRVRARVVVATVSLLLVLAGVALLLLELGSHPVDSVRVAGEFRHLERSDLEAVVAPHLGQSFFAVDVDAVRETVRSLPWVRDASVRRVWPGSIHIAVVERQAVFRWASAGLLEDDATLFTPATRRGFRALPLLLGPAGSEGQVREMHARLDHLLTPLGQRVEVLALSARGAWHAQLATGLTLVMGRDPAQAALRRLAQAFPAVLAGHLERVEVIDLRYANGFVVRWKALPPAEAEG